MISEVKWLSKQVRTECATGKRIEQIGFVISLALLPFGWRRLCRNFVFVTTAFVTPIALGQGISPIDGANCSLSAPPEAAAKGARPPHGHPMRLYPVDPGTEYSGCQWIWISYKNKTSWDYQAVTLYVEGDPVVHRVTTAAFRSEMICKYSNGVVSEKTGNGSNYDPGCSSSARLRTLLTIKPKENDWWEFW